MGHLLYATLSNFKLNKPFFRQSVTVTFHHSSISISSQSNYSIHTLINVKIVSQFNHLFLKIVLDNNSKEVKILIPQVQNVENHKNNIAILLYLLCNSKAMTENINQRNGVLINLTKLWNRLFWFTKGEKNL